MLVQEVPQTKAHSVCAENLGDIPIYPIYPYPYCNPLLPILDSSHWTMPYILSKY